MSVGDVAQWQSVPFAQGRPWVQIPISPFLFPPFFKTFSKNLKNAAQIVRQRKEVSVGDVAQWQSVPFAQGRPWVRIPISPYLFHLFFKTFSKKPKECSLECKTKEKGECWGCSSVVERPFRIGKALGSNPNISIFISSVFQNLFQKPKECSLDCNTKAISECRGCSSVVERPFRIGKAFGLNPNISIFI